MQVRGKLLPVVQAAPTISNHAGDRHSQLKLLIASKTESACRSETRLETLSIAVTYTSRSYSHDPTSPSVPVGSFIDIYV